MSYNGVAPAHGAAPPLPNSTSPRDWQRDRQAHDTKSSPAHSPKTADRCRCKDIEKPGHPCHIQTSLHGTVSDQNVSSGPTVAGTRVTQSRGSTRNAQSSVPPYRSRAKERGWLNGEMQKSTGESRPRHESPLSSGEQRQSSLRRWRGMRWPHGRAWVCPGQSHLRRRDSDWRRPQTESQHSG